MKKQIVLFVLLLSSTTFAASFKGYGKLEDVKSAFIENENIDTFIESKEDFLISFSKHSSFYKFPKIKVDAYDFKNYLNKMIKIKKVVKVEMNPMTTQIYKISD